MEKTYAIVPSSEGTYIQCLECNMKSYNVYDIEYKYCGKCHKYHKEK